MESIQTKKILVLDDSATVRADLDLLLRGWNFEPLLAANVAEAVYLLEFGVDFAIVDVFLEGARGDELSAEFVEKYLIPKNIPYGRFTSAPEFVPQEHQGLWVLHKYDVRSKPELMHAALLESLDKSS